MTLADPTSGKGAGVMAGDGFYDRHSSTQGGAATFGLDALRRAVADLELDDGDTVRLADLGSAQGHNSLAPLRAVVEALGERPAGIDVFHTDLSTNDWATLFEVIEHDPASYLVGREDVYPFVVGQSFYDRLFAPRSLHLAWTSSALHWLSEPAGPVGDHFFAPSSAIESDRARYRSLAADDWARFLRHRAVELAPSGSVVLVDVAMGDDGSMGSEALFDTLEAALGDALQRGDLTRSEYADTAYPSWFRTLGEMRAPFDPEVIGPGGERLVLEALDPVELADPFWPAYEGDGDAPAYGRAQAGFLRGFLAPSFQAAWPRPDDEQVELLDTIFTDCAERIASDPGAVTPHYRLVVGRIRRVA